MSSSGKISPSDFLRDLRRKTPEKPRGDAARVSAPVIDLPPTNLRTAQAPPPAPAPVSESANEEEFVNSGRGGVVRRKRTATPDVVRSHAHLAELFDRVNTLLGDTLPEQDETFRPKAPGSLREAGLNAEEVEKLVMKFLLQRGSATGRE